MNTKENPLLKDDVRNFWHENPCDVRTSEAPQATREYFDQVEQHRYGTHVELKRYVRFEDFKGKRVLEIGCGLGTDGRQFAQAGANYTGIDLTEAAIGMARKNFELHGQQGTFRQVDAENMPFETGMFDLVYSFGVLHHTPDIEKAFSEVNRILKPGGRFIVMVYHRTSWNYYINIMTLRRIGALLLYFPGGPQLVHKLTKEPLDRILHHKKNLSEMGFSYLSAKKFLHQDTDGPGNPLSRVFTGSQLADLLTKTGFTAISTKVGFLHKRWIPIVGRFISGAAETKLAEKIGWHLYGFSLKK